MEKEETKPLIEEFDRLEIKILIEEDKSSGKSVPTVNPIFTVFTKKESDNEEEIRGSKLEDYYSDLISKYTNAGNVPEKWNTLYVGIMYFLKYQNILREIYEKSFKEEPDIWENFFYNIEQHTLLSNYKHWDPYYKLIVELTKPSLTKPTLIFNTEDFLEMGEDKIVQYLIELYTKAFIKLRQAVIIAQRLINGESPAELPGGK